MLDTQLANAVIENAVIYSGKHQKRSTLSDDVRGCCGAVRKGEIRDELGTGAVEGSLVE